MKVQTGGNLPNKKHPLNRFEDLYDLSAPAFAE